MNVLIAVPSYPDARYTLPGLFHQTQAEALQRQGAEVDVVAPIPWIPAGISKLSSNWTRYRAMLHGEIINGLPICRPRYIHLPKGDFPGITDITFSAALAFAPAMRPEIIHAHFAYPCGYAAECVARHWNIPLVLTLHGSDVNVSPQKNRREMRRFQKVIRRASVVIAVSHALAAKTAEMTGLTPRVLPIGIDLEKFGDLPSQEECRKILNLPRDKKIALYAGDLLVAKGVPELLQGLRVLRDENVLGVFAGGGKLHQEVVDAGVGLVLGPRPNGDIPILMRAADVVVLPSHREGMPTVLIEAGAARVPVLATQVGGIPELLGDDRGYLIPPGNVAVLVEAIRRVLFTTDGQASHRADRLYHFVQEYYSVDRNARTLIDIYGEMLTQWRGKS